MKIALVHDYLKEYGGAERVLLALCEMFPEAPIFTAFCDRSSAAAKAFAGAKIIESKFAPLIKHKNLYSPLRFLTPLIWKSFDLSKYDLVITSASWYITRGFRIGGKTKVICYCHTPPRYLYGYPTSVEWQRYRPVRVYAAVVNHFLRQFDFRTAQEVDYFIANSRNVQRRVEKFYRRDSTVIYPPVDARLAEGQGGQEEQVGQGDYFLTGGRLEGGKNFELIVRACAQEKLSLKVYGSGGKEEFLRSLAGPTIEFLGRVTDEEKFQLLAGCRAFIAAAEDEDFGITPVEAMAAGRPVIAYRGGGYLETVVEGKTGVFFKEPTVEGLVRGIGDFREIEGKIKPEDCRRQAEEFDKSIFEKKIKDFLKLHGFNS